MVVETKYGKFELLKNDRECFDLEKFNEKYIPEYFDKYVYIVGDYADELLRLKGFSLDSKSKNYFHFIPDYITEGCSYNCKYYVLKRIKENTANNNKNAKINNQEKMVSNNE